MSGNQEVQLLGTEIFYLFKCQNEQINAGFVNSVIKTLKTENENKWKWKEKKITEKN